MTEARARSGVRPERRKNAAAGAAGVVSGWNFAALVTTGVSLRGALIALLARERGIAPSHSRAAMAVALAAKSGAARPQMPHAGRT